MIINIKELVQQTKDIRVLYVEDEESVREQTLMILEMLFTSIDSAFDGEDGWQKYQKSSYDIVFTDISMPRMGGLELTRHIKEQNPMQKVAIISAYNTADYLLEAIELGADGFILKPINMNKMMISIKKLADGVVAAQFMRDYNQQLQDEVQKKTQIIKKQALTDKLTTLQNRFALNTMLDSLEQEMSLVLVNIDNFDSINTIYGYDNGNKVIQSLAKLIAKNMPSNSELYYVGSDEFCIVAQEMDRKKIKIYAQDLQEVVANSFVELDGNKLKGTVTISIAQGRENLLKYAHIALKEAKNKGKNRIEFYAKELNVEKLQRQIQEYSPIIRQAIESGNVVPYFQPIIDNSSHKITKYECLARIEDGDQVYSPYYFIDVARMIGLVSEITKIMIDKSFKMFSGNDYEFSINITEVDLNDEYLYDYLKEKLQEYNIDVSRVILEVLEGVSAHGLSNSLQQLKRLKSFGFTIAIDDFGTQNSNFERVNNMNVDFIKIDGGFVKNMATDEKSYSIVKTISEFSKSIGAKVIAEYVHDKETQKRVEELGIEYSQGYYFSRPKRELD